MAVNDNKNKNTKSKQKAVKHRVTVTLSDDDYQKLVYWADKCKYADSINEYLALAIEHQIQHDNDDYIETNRDLIIQRLNQQIDALSVLSSDVHGLESMISSALRSLIGLTQGDNYLMDESERNYRDILK